MRARKKKHTAERLEACSDYLSGAMEEHRGAWRALFSEHDPALSENAPLWLEIGCGKGDFATELAVQNPEVAVLAVERVRDVLMLAAEKTKRREVPNLLLGCENAQRLPEFFAPGEVDRLYLNFSDPWPKARHADRRLTSPLFLNLYKQILAPEASIFFKTDNRPLFEYSLESFRQNGFSVSCVTFDLHQSEWNQGNIVTEYERAFSAQGMPICRLEAKRICDK